MKLSIVATLYRSAEYIQEFHRRTKAVAEQWAGIGNYEIILVDDGSPDNSLDLAVSLTEHDPHLTVIELSRNFGHHKAMMTGLAAARGDTVFLIDSDLEEQPEWLLSFAEQMYKTGCDVVYGVQQQRRGGWVEKYSGRLYYKVFRFLTDLDQPNNIVTARLMTRNYVKALVTHQERELNIGGLWVITGFRQTAQNIHKLAHSPTTYNLTRKVGHLVNAITSFSSTPLVITFYAGLIISLSAMLFIAYLVLRYYFIAAPPPGYTSIISTIWLFSGLIILFQGIQGIYMAKIFTEVKQRPYTIIRQIYTSTKADGQSH